MRSRLLGAGIGVGLGAIAAAIVRQRNRAKNNLGGPREAQKRKVRILILGGGFAGYYALRGLQKRFRRHEVEITLINLDNYMLFTSMLHEVAASDLDASDIVNPLRELIHPAKFFCGEVQKIDLEHKTVSVCERTNGETRSFGYDYLVIGLGSTANFYDLPGIEENSIPMKTIEDALFLRNHMIKQLELADFEAGGDIPALTFVVCGGGFSGVETVGAMTDFLYEASRSYPNLSRTTAKVILVHGGPQLLPELGSKLGDYAAEKLQERGVEIILNTQVSGFVNGAVEIGDGRNTRRIPTSTLVWTAGIKPAPAVQDLAAAKVKGRLLTKPTLDLPDWPGVYAIGDCAAIPDPYHSGEFYAATAQNALRQGELVAKNIAAVMQGGDQMPFRFKVLGQLAAIGHRRGIANMFGFRFSGLAAWWMWRTVYLYKLPGFQKKLRVGFDWLLDAVFRKDIVQYDTLRIANLRRQIALAQKTEETRTIRPAA